MISIFKHILLPCLIWSLIFPASVFAQSSMVYTEQEIKLIVSEYNRRIDTLENAVKEISMVDFKKSIEFKKSIQNEGIDIKSKLPKLVHQNKKIFFSLADQKIYFEFTNYKSIKISHSGRSIELNSNMSFVDMKGILTQLYNPKVSFLIDLIVSPANAELIALTIFMIASAGAALLFAVLAIFDAFITTQSLNRNSKHAQELCTKLENSTAAEDEFNKNAYEGYNQIASTYSFRCRDSHSTACQKVKLAKECLKKIIEKRIGINDSSRDAKKMIYDEREDIYRNIHKQSHSK